MSFSGYFSRGVDTPVHGQLTVIRTHCSLDKQHLRKITDLQHKYQYDLLLCVEMAAKFNAVF